MWPECGEVVGGEWVAVGGLEDGVPQGGVVGVGECSEPVEPGRVGPQVAAELGPPRQ